VIEKCQKYVRCRTWQWQILLLCWWQYCSTDGDVWVMCSSQPLTLLLAAAIYDLPTGTVSLCLAVDSARTAIGLSTMPALQSGTRCLTNLEILTVLIVLNGS